MPFSVQVKLRQFLPFQIHTGTSAPESSVPATFSSPVALDLIAPGKTEKPGQPDDAHPQFPTASPVPVKSTAKAQAETSVPSGVPTNGSAPTAQSSTAAAPSTAATTPGKDLQGSSNCHLLRLFQTTAVWKNICRYIINISINILYQGTIIISICLSI